MAHGGRLSARCSLTRLCSTGWTFLRQPSDARPEVAPFLAILAVHSPICPCEVALRNGHKVLAWDRRVKRRPSVASTTGLGKIVCNALLLQQASVCLPPYHMSFACASSVLLHSSSRSGEGLLRHVRHIRDLVADAFVCRCVAPKRLAMHLPPLQEAHNEVPRRMARTEPH